MIALALILAQDPLAKPVTLPATVANAKVVVRTLAQASGTKLATLPLLESEIVGLAVPNRPLREAMDALAKAMDAGWEKRDGVPTLIRTNAQSEARRRRDRETRVAQLRTSILEATKAISTTAFDKTHATNLANQATSAATEKPEFTAKSPFHQFHLGLIRAIPAEEFADMRIDEFRTYAFDPHPVQRPFPESARALLAKYAIEQKLLNQAFEGSQELIAQFKMHAYRNDGVPARTLLTVRRIQKLSQGSLEYELSVFNSIGAITASARTEIPFTGDFTKERSTQAPAAAAQDIVVEPTQDATRLRNHIQKRMTGKNEVIAFPPELDDLLRNPTEKEPLAMSSQAPMAAMAKSRGATIAAALPDSLLMPLIWAVGNGRTTLARWERDLDLNHVEKLTEGQSIVYRPKLPVLAEEIQTDRDALTKFLRALTPFGHVRLQAQIEFAVAQAERRPLYAESLTNRLQAYSIYGNQTYFRFFGLLSSAQKTLLREGKSLATPDLSPLQRELLRQMTYDNYGWTWIAPKALGTPDEKGSYGGPSGSIRRQVTERLPNGLPGTTKLIGKVGTKPTWHTVVDGPGQSFTEADPSALAQAFLNKEIGSLDYRVGERFQRAESTYWELASTFEPDLELPFFFSDHRLTDEFCKYDQLPDRIKSETQRLLGQFRQYPRDNETRGKVPPP